MRSSFVLSLSLLIALLFAGLVASAQQIGVGVTNQSLTDSYFERTGLHWGLRFRQGSFHLGLPPFGGYVPGAGIIGGYRPFGFEFSQGSSRTFTTQTPMVVVSNGVPGFITESSWTPFVIGTVPVVGGFPIMTTVMPPVPPIFEPTPTGNPAVQQALQQARANPQAALVGSGQSAARQAPENPERHRAAGHATVRDDPAAQLAAAQKSSAGRAVPSVAQAKQARQAERAGERAMARDYLGRGRKAEEAGKTSVAKIYYQMAARRADGDLKTQILKRLEALQPASETPP